MKKSHGGERKNAGRKAVDGARRTKPRLVLLDAETEKKARAIGGSVSAGIRVAVKAYPS